MKQSHGSEGLQVVECINPRLQKYRVRWDIQPDVEERDGHVSNGVVFYEEEFNHKPSIDEIKDLILTWYNSEIDKKIVSGFVWNDIPVWLSTENQFNYKTAFDIAVQSGGSNLPITFKFGNDVPVYHQFQTVEELTDFYTKAVSYIQSTLEEGWVMKDALDFSEYEACLS